MEDAAKHAFTNESGWSDGHPPQEVRETTVLVLMTLAHSHIPGGGGLLRVDEGTKKNCIQL